MPWAGSAGSQVVPFGAVWRTLGRFARTARTGGRRTLVLWTTWWNSWWRNPFPGSRSPPRMHRDLPRRRDTRGDQIPSWTGRLLSPGSGIWSGTVRGASASMDSRRHEGLSATDAALDFVRFCHRRRRVGWPELYDEMCHVARRGLYHGWGFGELAEHGIAFGLAEMPGMARLVAIVAGEESERRGRLTVGVPDHVPARIEGSEEAAEDSRQPRVLIGAAG